MGFALTAGQPSTVAGTQAGSTITLSTHVTKWDVSGAAEIFKLKANNKKYTADGGAIGFDDTLSFEVWNTKYINRFFRGAYWTTVTATYQAEGPSANAGAGFGTVTATINSMRIASCSQADSGGRMALSGNADLLSSDQTTAPIAWAKA